MEWDKRSCCKREQRGGCRTRTLSSVGLPANKEDEVPDDAKELTEIKQEDVEAVTEKLKEWMPTLPEQEQLVMGWVLTRAAAADDTDVKEYTESSEGGVPVSTLMA